MMTPWFMLYRLGIRLDAWLEAELPMVPSTLLVGGFYFFAIFALVWGATAILHGLAPDSAIDVFMQAQFDVVLVITAAAFMVYVLVRCFWDGFLRTPR